MFRLLQTNMFRLHKLAQCNITKKIMEPKPNLVMASSYNKFSILRHVSCKTLHRYRNTTEHIWIFSLLFHPVL